MTPSTLAGNTFLAGFSALEKELAARGPDWLSRLRRDSLARFEELGFPSSRLEEWKNTSVAPIASTAFRPGTATHPSATDLPEPARLALNGPRLFFSNGHLVPQLCSTAGLPEGVWLGSLARAWREIPERVQPHLLERPPGRCASFRALNGAFVQDGALLWIPEGAQLMPPIQLLYGSTGASGPTASQPRTVIEASPGSHAKVVEIYFGLDERLYLTNAVTDVRVGDGASLEHYRVQLESPLAYHVSSWTSRQTRDSRYISHNVNLGGRLVRQDVEAVMDGLGAYCRLNGLYFTRGEQHLDNHTTIDHAQPHGDSREVYKGILDGRSRAVFNGRIIVRPGAQKTDAKQSNPNLVLSSGALAHTRPQLEIYANDVKCTHGATIGRLDEEALFYLRARGLDQDQARRLLIQAFADEMLELIDLEPLQAYLKQVLSSTLPGR